MDQKVYGDTPHPAVARDLNNLGGAWGSLGEYRKAIDYYTQALAMFETTLPNDHPDIQIVRANLRQAQLSSQLLRLRPDARPRRRRR
jgi:tetratricopeptide (TPR) repeat protein